ncbi:MAG: porin [Phycisphaeraceae bacterium]
MPRKMTKALLAGALLSGVTGHATAGDGELEQLRAEMAQMRAELAQLRAQQEGDWMTSARRAEIEGLIADAFADANQRASLLQEGALAGIDDKGKIFLMSSDGTFNINFNGQVQFRYIWNSLDTDNTSGTRTSESLSGFQARRMKFGMRGKVGDGWGFKYVFATMRGTGPGGGTAFSEDVYITKDLGDGWEILVGTNKLPFARQEIISSTRQVGIDRGLATEFFTLNRSDQVAISHEAGDWQYVLALSDGGNADFTEFTADASTDFALTGRVDWMAMGEDWGENKHEFGGVDQDHLFIGAAVHYEVAEGSAGGLPEDGLAWTVDAVYKTGPLGLSAAFFGNHTDNGPTPDTDQYGLYVQGDVAVGNGWDVFGRWEWIDDDGVAGAGTDELQAVTVGVNHHFNAKVKFTADVVWVYAGDNPTSDGNFINGGELGSGLGLTSTAFTAADDHDDQIALRLQLQLLF